MELPATGSNATLFILARPHGINKNPLHISINGIQQEPINTALGRNYHWYNQIVKARDLVDGTNTVELWTQGNAMTGWSLALESGSPTVNCFVTDDKGDHWRSERMGYLNVCKGNYCVRMRLQEGEDGPPPKMIWESADHPRVQSLRESIPRLFHYTSDRLAQVRSLASWLASSWQHSGSDSALIYTPWDAETIIAWGGRQRGHNNERPISMCVHYAVAFVSSCQALRIPARCAALIGTPNSFDGHFVAEVWLDEYQKWIMVDPNCDAIFFRNGYPLSIDEIRDLREDLTPYVEWGKGTRYQRTFAHMRNFMRDNLLRGVCFRHRSVWPRTDFLTHPENSPPGHGSLSYCETDLVWTKTDLDSDFGMFKYFAPSSYFTAPPYRDAYA